MTEGGKTTGSVPVLVGIGIAAQREENPEKALDALALMREASRRAGADTGTASVLATVERVYVPKGRWKYEDPGRHIAAGIGAAKAESVLSTVGVLQQSLIGAACSAITAGEISAALVVGGDCGYRIMRSRKLGVALQEPDAGGKPDVLLAPKEELRHPAEIHAGMRMPVGLYAIMESAFRARHGWSISEHRARLGTLYSGFSAIAAQNPAAWLRSHHSPDEVVTPSAGNSMQAIPYTQKLCSSWNVDQAASLLFCSTDHAERLGIPKERWIYPWASTESNHMIPVCARAELDRCPGARIAGAAALARFDLTVDDIDLIELYSCFPIAVEAFAEELSIPAGRDLTITGGMSFAGGPYNNYVLQATARMGELLRQGRSSTGLVGSVSGVLTKQGFGLWSKRPPHGGFQFADVTNEVSRAVSTRDVIMDAAGAGRIAGYTALFERGRPPRGVAIVDLADGRRAVAVSEDAATIGRIADTELCGAPVTVEEAKFHLAA